MNDLFHSIGPIFSLIFLHLIDKMSLVDVRFLFGGGGKGGGVQGGGRWGSV